MTGMHAPAKDGTIISPTSLDIICANSWLVACGARETDTRALHRVGSWHGM